MPTSVQTDDAEQPAAVLQLRQIGDELEKALKESDAVRFNRLTRKRSKLIQRLHCAYPGKGLPPELIEEIVRDNRNWIQAGQKMLSRMKSSLADLKNLKKTTDSIQQAYKPASSPGKYFSGNG